MKAAWISVLLASALAGCSTSIQVSSLGDVKVGGRVDGVPFRVPKRFTAVIYEKRPEGYIEVHRMPVTVADPEHLYLLQMKGQPLSNATVEVLANPDNTLQQVSVKSASTFSAALTATGASLNAAATAQEAKEKKEATAATAAATAGTAAATATSSASIAADKAKQAADEAQLDYDLLLAKTDATPAALLAAKNKARSRKLDANEAARLANKPAYFPDVIP